MKRKILAVLLAVVLVLSLSLVTAVPVMAVGDNGQVDSDVNDPAITIGADWSATTAVPPAFFWGSGSPPVPSGSDPFTFTNTGLVRVDVTDDLQNGDQFGVYDNSVAIGDTSSVAVVAGSEIGPEAAFNDVTFSSGSFILGPGSHSIEIEAITNPYNGGRGYIRVVQLVEFDKEIIGTTEAGDMDGVLETGEDWHWTMKITLKNVSGETITVDKVHDRLGGDIELDAAVTYSALMGSLNQYTKGKTDKVFLNWYDGFSLADGEEVSATITVSPDMNTGHGNGKNLKFPDGHQEFTSPGEHCLNSGAYFEGYIGTEFISASTLPVCVDVLEAD